MLKQGNCSVLKNNSEEVDIYSVSYDESAIKEVMGKLTSDKRNVDKHYEDIGKYDFKEIWNNPHNVIVNLTRNDKCEEYEDVVTDGSGCSSYSVRRSGYFPYYTFDILSKKASTLYFLLERLLNDDFNAAFEIINIINEENDNLEKSKKNSESLINSMSKNSQSFESKIDELHGYVNQLVKAKNDPVYEYYQMLTSCISTQFVETKNVAQFEDEIRRLQEGIKKNQSILSRGLVETKTGKIKKG